MGTFLRRIVHSAAVTTHHLKQELASSDELKDLCAGMERVLHELKNYKVVLQCKLLPCRLVV